MCVGVLLHCIAAAAAAILEKPRVGEIYLRWRVLIIVSREHNFILYNDDDDDDDDDDGCKKITNNNGASDDVEENVINLCELYKITLKLYEFSSFGYSRDRFIEGSGRVMRFL
jgi:hypothetical protein